MFGFLNLFTAMPSPQPCKSRARQNFGAGLKRYNSPADKARQLFKPSTATVHNLRPYGRMRPLIMKFASVCSRFSMLTGR